jgi:hypothetical protein
VANKRIWSWFDQGNAVSAILGVGDFRIHSHTWRSHHDDLLVLRELCGWADDRDQWPAARAAVAQAISESPTSNAALGLVWAAFLVGDGLHEQLVTEDQASTVLDGGDLSESASDDDQAVRQAVRDRVARGNG